MTNSQAKSELMQIYMSLSEEKKQALDVLMAQADGEYISRQAVMNCFKKWQPYMATRLHEFEKELSEMPSVAIPSAEPKWIPVSERFPKPNECVGNVCRYYLIQNEYGDMMIAMWDGIGWEQMYQYGEYIEDEVIAWMPLPKPYEPQERSDKE